MVNFAMGNPIVFGFAGCSFCRSLAVSEALDSNSDHPRRQLIESELREAGQRFQDQSIDQATACSRTDDMIGTHCLSAGVSD
jgi:hypothetical protein